MLTPSSGLPGSYETAPLKLESVRSRLAPDGLYTCHGSGRSSVYAVLLGEVDPTHSVSALIPIDALSPDRLAGAERFWRIANGLHAPDTRLSNQRRSRLVLMIRAADGDAVRASRRQIAEGLFGKRRVAAELWAESSLRYATIRLVRDGRAIIDHGYRDLLRHRRRP
ncbi:hypothetical protein A9995_14975 [Erythrobacter sp. QSSC1-22B]|uniref:DUF2285 domain-containing protein n=1 Tax=Erythrobacter sp. QSSC1-22B TaxID=1860125 RepID=UPI0008049CCD|nr:DUF2285 domain-containing protein [Erythrobacter sp. QSSC1-22B]OBX17690.1 hypothetical protein A9995_14975 [Erythrobacter sp. QSSC1-22B]